MLTAKKQRASIFSEQKLVDYIEHQVDYQMDKSTKQEGKSTNRLMMCVCVCVFKAFNILINIIKHIHSHYPWEVLSM